ncbi:HmuY family protein [Seonamhaeicola marinus]|uniref:HmuY family protein n=1 Tax=Seonamhaeicola marinus TaxID=1912246 RepID=A0A5D0HTW9_9FLAO|nr:HmuY family protein [Seonamhaeicola marinus]TYA74350.1 hypothetical protein FUA24_13570 [Seonamhaeicola marinus]
MKTLKLLTLLALFIGLSSCSNDDDSPTLLETESKTITNLAAVQTSDYTTNPPTISGEFTRFSFASGATTTGNDWDIAFRGTTVLINGGVSQGATNEPNRSGNGAAYIASGTLAGVVNVDASLLLQDSASGLAIPTGSDNGWYNYSGHPTHLITPLAGKVLVIKTNDGKYAKVEILSYYKDGDTSSDSQHYTFSYVYQPNEGVTTF